MAFFLLRNILNILWHFVFLFGFYVFSSPINNAIGILMGISLIGRLLLNYNHFLNINFFQSRRRKDFLMACIFNKLFSYILYFSLWKTLTSLVRLFPNIYVRFLHLGCFFLMFFLSTSLLEYVKITDVYMLTWYPENLLKVFFKLKSCL